MPAQDTHIGRSTPLGPMVVGATFRGFAALTRGYRVVRPLRGRQHRRMPIQMWHEDGGTTTACCGDGDGDDVAPAILQRNGDGEGGPKGPNYSITAGEHGEPAEGEPHIYVRPQGGRTGIRLCMARGMTEPADTYSILQKEFHIFLF